MSERELPTKPPFWSGALNKDVDLEMMRVQAAELMKALSAAAMLADAAVDMAAVAVEARREKAAHWSGEPARSMDAAVAAEKLDAARDLITLAASYVSDALGAMK